MTTNVSSNWLTACPRQGCPSELEVLGVRSTDGMRSSKARGRQCPGFRGFSTTSLTRSHTPSPCSSGTRQRRSGLSEVTAGEWKSWGLHPGSSSRPGSHPQRLRHWRPDHPHPPPSARLRVPEGMARKPATEASPAGAALCSLL